MRKHVMSSGFGEKARKAERERKESYDAGS